VAEIRKNDTGEIREYKTDELLRNGDITPSVFKWEDNNYSCDCNRRLCFDRASDTDEDTDEDTDVVCSHGKYSVNLKNKKDGKVYYREFGAQPKAPTTTNKS